MPLAQVKMLVLITLSSGMFCASASELMIGGSGTDIATMRIMAQGFNTHHPDIAIKVLPSLGSGGGIKALSKGKLQIGLASRPLKSSEQAYPVRAYRYARTPMVLATQASNHVHAIQSQIFFAAMMGKKQYWPDGQLIRLVLRPISDSDSILLLKTYPQAEKALNQAYHQRGIPVAATDQKSARALESIDGSLGTTTLAVIQGEKRNLKALTLDGVTPTPENLSNGKYPMSKDLYLVLPIKPETDALKFVEYLRSSHGARILLETGHLPTAFALD